MGAWPNRVQIRIIDENVIEDADVDTWEVVLKTWSARGFSPVNVEGMIDWFKSGIPPSKKNGGKAPSAPATDLSGWKDLVDHDPGEVEAAEN